MNLYNTCSILAYTTTIRKYQQDIDKRYFMELKYINILSTKESNLWFPYPLLINKIEFQLLYVDNLNVRHLVINKKCNLRSVNS